MVEFFTIDFKALRLGSSAKGLGWIYGRFQVQISMGKTKKKEKGKKRITYKKLKLKHTHTHTPYF